MQITKNGSLSKVDVKFYELKINKKLALMPFIMAGDPNIEITSEILLKLQENGADLIELGIPYSDPLADGPIIQLSASRALKSGTTPRKVITLLESLKGKLNIPIILFTYFLEAFRQLFVRALANPWRALVASTTRRAPAPRARKCAFSPPGRRARCDASTWRLRRLSSSLRAEAATP